MPVPTYQQYLKMLEAAHQNKYAFAAVNVTSTSSANAVIQALQETKTDGIVQVSTGGGTFLSGIAQDMALGAMSLAQHVHNIAAKADVFIALHTDHCIKDRLDKFLIPLVDMTEARRKRGEPNLFNSHMFDGGTLPLAENLKIAKELHQRLTSLELVLEIETGVVGGEEDGINHHAPAKLYTTNEDMLTVAQELSPIGPYLYAATFGNVHGVYKPGGVSLKPTVLKNGQDAIRQKYGDKLLQYLVFHGGSGSSPEEIREAVSYGVVKMNIDTDTQYAYSRPVVDHVFKKYDQMLKIEGEVGNKKEYDPRTWLKLAEEGMKDRVIEAITILGSKGKSICS